jgi:CheY-like chemotaxis protein
VGRGSTFSVTLPRVAPPAPVPLEALMTGSLQGFGLSGAFIAVVENDETVREATASLIERWSCTVASAPSTDELVALVEAHGQRPDVILADFHLDHDRTGLEAIERLRTRFAAAIPAIVVTADYSGDTARLVQAAGVELIKKPVKPAELRALLTHLIG